MPISSDGSPAKAAALLTKRAPPTNLPPKKPAKPAEKAAEPAGGEDLQDPNKNSGRGEAWLAPTERPIQTSPAPCAPAARTPIGRPRFPASPSPTSQRSPARCRCCCGPTPVENPDRDSAPQTAAQ